MSTGKQMQFKIKANNKDWSISRDLYHALEADKKKLLATQKDSQSMIENANREVTTVFYGSQTNNLLFQTHFTEKGEIDTQKDRTLVLQGEYGQYSKDIQDIIRKAIIEFMLCSNQCLRDKNSDVMDKIKTGIKAIERRIAA